MSGMNRYASTSAARASASWASRSACSGSPCAIATRARMVSADISHQPGRRRDGDIGPPAGRGEIPASQCGLRNVRALRRRRRSAPQRDVPTPLLVGRASNDIAAVTSPLGRSCKSPNIADNGKRTALHAGARYNGTAPANVLAGFAVERLSSDRVDMAPYGTELSRSPEGDQDRVRIQACVRSRVRDELATRGPYGQH